MRRFAIVIGFLCFGCGPSEVVRTAYYGDLKSLKAEIRAARQTGALDRGEVTDLARAVARRELRSTRGPDAISRIQEVRTCVEPVIPELRERAEKYDDAGAEATLVLIDANLADRKGLVRRYARADSGAWRAVAARTTASTHDGALRRQFIEDPDERVRRAALHASLEASAMEDTEALLDAARLDPSPLNRSLAVRALGGIGGERVVMALKDRWERSDEQERLTLIEAWADPASLPKGGERELLQVLDTTASLPAIAAAFMLLRASPPAADRAQAALVRAIANGTTAERRLAIQWARLDQAGISALIRASTDGDAQVRVLSLARLLDVPERRAASQEALRRLAAGTGSPARQARAALTAIEDGSVEPYLQRDLAAADAGQREVAAFGLFRLGRYAVAATALGDDDGRVRMAVACRILADQSHADPSAEGFGTTPRALHARAD